MLASGSRETCQDMAPINGEIKENTSDSSPMIRNRASEFISNKMVRSMRVTGMREDKMAMVPSILIRARLKSSMVFGRKVDGLAGSIKKHKNLISLIISIK